MSLTPELTDSWVITNGGSEPISLTFSDPFWLETGFTHCYDYLRITNSRTGESWDLCGEDVPSDLNLDTDKVEVTLFTDFANNHEGFRMTYQTSGEMNTTPSPTTPGSTTEGPSTSEGTTGRDQCILSWDLLCLIKTEAQHLQDLKSSADTPPSDPTGPWRRRRGQGSSTG